MKHKNLLYYFLLVIFVTSCKESIIETDPITPQTNNLKSSLLANNYYVTKSGNDSNPGTILLPFLTIQKAANVVNPGDNVIVGDGIFSTTGDQVVWLSRSGSDGNYITFRSEHKWGAVLDGKGASGYGFIIAGGASYIRFIDFEVKNFLNWGIFCNDQTNQSNYITTQGCKIHDIGRVNDTGNVGKGGIYFRMKNHHWTVTQNLFYNCGRIGPDTQRMIYDHAVYIGSADVLANVSHDNIISYNVMFACSGNPLNIGSNYDLIENNVMAWPLLNSATGVSLIATGGAGGSYITVANNIFYQPDPTAPSAISIYTNPSFVATWSVKNNIVYGGRMWGDASSAFYASAMKGGNYGKTDCEKGEVNPLFVSVIKTNAPNVDFSLQATSPAINNGVNMGLTTDYLGNSIIGLPDIGAYEYFSQTSAQTTYYNIQMSATATKSDCGTGYTGSTVTYTVAAGKYSSTVSQADADAKASADLTANKQVYANANGTCTLIAVTTFYNIQMSATATKSDCGTGYTGSTVTYTVSAGKYSSTVSQADADAKASADLTANKQAYANANGTCTLIAVTTYYNVQMSATATKNDCGTGYTGSTVTYTVTAKKYSSTVSQADANAKASADLTANKQAYANANGTCTIIKKRRH